MAPASVTPPPNTTTRGSNTLRTDVTRAPRIAVVSLQISSANVSPSTAAVATSDAVTAECRDRMDGRPAIKASWARRAMDVPDTYASAHPRWPQSHKRPSQSTTVWPNSATFPDAPRSSRPATSAPPPMPVEIVRYTRSCVPAHSPHSYVASAAAFASFSRKARRWKAASASLVTGTSSQAGRFGGRRMIPAAASSGPPLPIPTAVTRDGAT